MTLLDLLTGNVWDQLMFDTVGATGRETGVVFYVAWLVLSRWLTVAMVVTVLLNRIDVDTEDYLKIAAKTSMRSVFALEHAFMQVRTWATHYVLVCRMCRLCRSEAEFRPPQDRSR